MAVKLDSPRGRVVIIGLVFLLVFFLMALKAFHEQIRIGGEHRNAVSRQSIRKIRIPAKRGKIFSSDLRLLAESVVSYDVNFYFDEMRQPGPPSRTINYATEVYHRLSAAVGRDPFIGDDEIKYHVYNRAGLPLGVFSNLNNREIAAVFKLQQEFPGIEVVPGFLRFYPEYDLAAHLIGYAQRQDPATAGDRKEFFYYRPDLIGKIGLEKYCDSFKNLRGLGGEPGFELVKVDNYGFVREVLHKTGNHVNGNNVVLTVDSRAQRIAERLLRGKVGAMVVLDANTGEIIAMSSQPSYNLNLFSPFIGRERYSALADDPDKPLFNRAVYGSYMAGSVMKVLSALAFLENGTDPEEEMECDGESFADGVRIRCASWRSGGHGKVNFYSALERSCNDYIIDHAVAVGVDELAKQYAAAGVGRSTGFELGGAIGLLPSAEVLKRREKRTWSRADTGFVSIGQGLIEISPLQGALIAAAIANGGDVMRPFIVKKIIDDNGNVLRETKIESTSRLAASRDHINMVKQGMFQVVNGSHASGKLAKNETITLYGKTGTAEFGKKPNLKNNSFFICFGEHNGRTYAMFIVVEVSGGGGRDCAPLAGSFFEQYLK